MKRLFCLLAGCLIVGVGYSEVTVTNVVAQQRPGTKLVDIAYDVFSTETAAVDVSLAVSNGMSAVSAPSVTGDVGDGVVVGVSKSMVWDMGADWVMSATTLTFQVMAADTPRADVVEVVNDRWIKNYYSNGDITMYDIQTRNMWPYHASQWGGANWYDAEMFCDNLVYGGYDDWGLPELSDLDSLFPLGAPLFDGVPEAHFWSDTPVVDNTNNAYMVFVSISYIGNLEFWQSGVGNISKASNAYIWPVCHIPDAKRSIPVTAMVDNRDYALFISSKLGTPVPNIGNNTYEWNSTVICSVDAVFIENGIHWQNAGWTGTGSAPVSGTTNTTGVITLTNLESSVTWNWEPGFSITNVVANQRADTKLVDIGYDLISDITNAATISFQILNGSSSLPITSATGDVGAEVLPGTDKSIVWNAGVDWDGNVDTLTFKVMHSTETNLADLATASIDSRDYTLSVSSDHGLPVPNIGNSTYAWHATVTCSVAAASIEDGINWQSTGWTGTGSVPSNGATNTTGAITLTNLESSIAWSWDTDFTITNVVAVQRPGTKLVSISYDLISDITNAAAISIQILNDSSSLPITSATGDFGDEVLPGAGKSIVWNAGVDWDENLDNLTFKVMHSTETNLADLATASIDSRDYTLFVSSDHGLPVPNIGNSTYAWHATVTCSVAAASIEDGINWQSTGWTGTGSVPSNGATNTTGAITLTNLESSIAWSWDTDFTITNVVAVQRPGTKLVDISYDILSDVTNGVPIGLQISDDGSVVSSESASGDIGENVFPGSGKSILWNAGADWDGNAAELLYNVFASAGSAPEGFVLVEAGMAAGGSPTIAEDFYIAKYEVTNEQMRQVMQWAYDQGGLITASADTVRNSQGNPQELLDLDDVGCQIRWVSPAFVVDSGKENYPCVEVTWYGSAAYCNYLSAKQGLTPAYNLSTWELVGGADGYRLPSDTQWEYAARGGKAGNDTEYSGSDTIGDVAWYNSNSSSHQEVGSKAENELETHDMSGNVWEWCYDWHPAYEDSRRVLRGGSWYYSSLECSVSYRASGTPGGSQSDIGFRLALPANQQVVSSASASLFADARDYTLSVYSDHDTPFPNIGTNLYAWASTVTCSVEAVATETPTNWICAGWSGSGSISSSGQETSTGPVLLTNLESSITWLWPTYTVNDLWAQNVSAVQRPGTKLVDISYDLHSTEANVADVALSVSNSLGSVSSSSLSGDVGSGVSTGTTRTIVWDAGADWDGNLDNLTFRILGQDAQGASIETPSGRVAIPAVVNSGEDPDSGAYSITVSNALFMDATEITKAQWDAVYSWAITNGYSFDHAGSATASNHPVHTISWTDAAKWCNARSEMDGFTPCYDTNDWSCNFDANGYRLPLAEEWQAAARGGLSGTRFPWGDTITHSNANYYSSSSLAYDISPTRGFHPDYSYSTAPANSGTVNGYGLYAMAGNVMEWCQDESGVNRILAGGSFDQFATEARCGYTSQTTPSGTAGNIGFRTVQRASSSTEAQTGLAVPVDTRDYLLTVESAHGSPLPGIGTNSYAWRATVTGTVESSVISGLTNWTSTGWIGNGSVPVSGGSTNTGAFMLTNLVSSITWNWNTNYWLETSTNGQGQVSGGNRWVEEGSNAQIIASASSDWLFMGWSGDASGDYTQESIIIPMVRPVSVNATFSDDADNDGILNVNETGYGTNPRKRDTDGDGSDDSDELVAGTSPTNSASVLDIQLNLSGPANELSWYGVSGRYYQLQYTDDLGTTWTPKGTIVSGANAPVMKLDIGAGEHRFYRIRVSQDPNGFD